MKLSPDHIALITRAADDIYNDESLTKGETKQIIADAVEEALESVPEKSDNFLKPFIIVSIFAAVGWTALFAVWCMNVEKLVK